MNWRRSRRWGGYVTLLGLSVALVLLSACAHSMRSQSEMFAGDQTAILRADYRQDSYLFSQGTVTITEVDGKSLARTGDEPVVDAVEVIPGKHSISFRYAKSSLCLKIFGSCDTDFASTEKLVVDVRGGRVYRLYARYRFGELWTWIVDEREDRVVAGVALGGHNWAAGQRSFGLGMHF